MPVVPGSAWSGTPDPILAEWIGAVHPTTTWTLSVGTASSHVPAGALDGAAATTRSASAQRLTAAGVAYRDERVVRAGTVLTSAGTSAGINLAPTELGLGPAVAQTVQPTLGTILDRSTTPTLRRRPADIGEPVSSSHVQRCN